jgi:hypothetical protein
MNNQTSKVYQWGPFKITHRNLIRLVVTDLLALLLILVPLFIAYAAEMLQNGSFSSDISTNWSEVAVTSGLTVSWDAAGQANGGAARFETAIGARNEGDHYLAQSTLAALNSTDTVQLVFWWKKNWVNRAPSRHTVYFEIQKPSTSVVRIWEELNSDNSNTWTQFSQDISSNIDEDGVYEFRFGADMRNGNDGAAQSFVWVDEISVDATTGGDSTPPTGVAITDPTEGQRISGTYTLSANATDETAMDRVEFYYGGSNLIGTDNTEPEPFTFGWDTTGVTDGSYSLTAVAYDTAANSTTSAAVNVTVDNTAPTVVSATAIDSTTADVLFDEDINGGTVAAGDFSIDNGLSVTNAVLQGDNVTVRLTTSSQTGGLTYAVTVTGTVEDIAGNNVGIPNSAQFTGFSSDSTPPSVSLTDPTEGQVINGTYGLSANASDETAMDRVEFYYGGTNLIGTDNTLPSPFTTNWITTGVGDGGYALTAVAYDTSSNSTTSTAVNVTVDNTNPTSTITDPTPSQILPSTNYAIVGTADDTNFTQYTLEYGAGASPSVWSDIGTNPRVTPVVAGTLGTWDTSGLSDGTYTIRLITTDDATNSTTDTVTVDVDITQPTVVSATEVNSTTVDVLFDEDMDGGTVQAGDFSIDNGLTVSNAVLQGDNRTVRLTTSVQTASTIYTVTMVGTVTDVAGNNVGTPNSAQFTGIGLPLLQGGQFFDNTEYTTYWTPVDVLAGLTYNWDTPGQANGGDALFQTGTAARDEGDTYLAQSTTAALNSTDTVDLIFWWKKNWTGNTPTRHTLYVEIVKPVSSNVVRIYEDLTFDNSDTWTQFSQDISSDIDENGVYEFRFGADMRNANNGAGLQTFGWFDEISLTATGGGGDSTPPTGVAITDPTEGQIIGGTYGLSANATDETAMDRVEFYHGGTNLIGTDSSAPQPFTFGWDTTLVTDGGYSLTAVAYDTSNNSTTSPAVNVTVDNTNPTATITDPTPAQLLPITSYAIVGTANDTNFAQYTLEYGSGGSPSVWNDIGTNPRLTPVTSGTLGTWDTSVLASGTYTIRLIVTDDATNSSTATVTVDVDTVRPTVASATAVSSTTVDVLFSEDINGSTVQAADFSINNGLTLSNAVLQGDSRTVRLTTSTQTGGLTYTMTVIGTVEDLAGNNVGTPNSAQFTGFVTDSTPPSVSITDPTEGGIVGGVYTISADATDDTAMDRVEFYYDGVNLIGTDNTLPTPFTIGWDTTVLTEGAYTLTARAFDTSNNNTTSTGINVTVDNTNPTATITDPTPSQLLPGTTYSIVGTADDTNFAQYTLEFGVGASPSVWNDIGTNPRTVSVVSGVLGGWDTTSLSNGTYTIRLVVTDDANNSSTATVTVTVDSTQPTVASASAPSDTQVNVLFSEDLDGASIDPSYFTINFGLGVSGATLLGDNRTVQLTTDVQTGGLTYTVTVKLALPTIEDVAGNSAGTPNTTQFTGFEGGDTTPPIVSITDPVNAQVIDGTYTISANASDETAMDRVEFFYDGPTLIGTDNTGPQPYTIGWNTTLVADGGYSLTAVAYDTSANNATSTPISVTVDNTNPTSVISDPLASQLLPGVNYVIVGTATDPNFLQYTLEYGAGASPSVWNDIGGNPRSAPVAGSTLGQWNTSPLTDGTYTIRLITTDVLSHTSTATVTVDIDSTSPTVVSATAVGTTTVDVLFSENMSGASINLAYFTIDNGLAVSAAVLHGDNQTVRLTTSAQNPSTTYTVTVKGTPPTVEDVAGNIVGVPNTAQFDGFAGGDVTPPTVSVVDPTEGGYVNSLESIDATATDDFAIDRVEFFYDSNLIGTDTFAPYNVVWDTTLLAETSYALTATAYDTSANNTTSTAVNVTVDNTFPTADVTDPVASQLIPSTNYTVTGTADDSNFNEYLLQYGVGASPSVWNDIGTNPRVTPVVSGTLGTWDTSGLADGTYTLRLVTTDLAIVSSADAFLVNIDSTSPTVVSATEVNAVQVDVLFSENINGASIDSTYFTINNGLTVNGATLQPDSRTVRLNTTSQTPAQSYTVTVKATTPTVEDIAGNIVGSPNTANFSGFGGAPTSAITSPVEGQILNSSTNIVGTATDSSFTEYLLEVAPGKDVSSGFEDIGTNPHTTPVVNGTLDTWDAASVNDGDYTIQLTTKNASAQEAIAQVRVIVDDTPPFLDSARASSDTTVDVRFREQLSGTLDPAYFSIAGLSVTGAVLLDDLKMVQLTTSTQTPDNPYTVTARTTSPTVADIGGTEVVAPNNTADFTGYSPAAIRGDGNLLRRSADDSTCGGMMMGCHNLGIHSSDTTSTTYGTWGRDFTCLTCHDAHGTPNIFLIKQTITTPNSGDMTVDFRILTGGVEGVHDFSLGDATDGFNDSVCEVCHTQPGHFRNDDAQTPATDHNNDSDCMSCHPHEAGFALAGGGESSGGSACGTCHGSIYTPMNSDTSQYHHYQASDDATSYPVVADSTTLTATDSDKTCLMCHVDHDIFNPTLNANSTGRADNLRETIKSGVTVSSNFTNSDYSSSHADGGICLSCHTNSMTKNTANQKSDGSTTTIVIDMAAYDAATTAHNYNATSTFSGSTFNANCSKCHSDTLPKSYQGGSGNAFSLHASVLNWLLAPLGIASPTSGDDPLEEVLCQACHAGGAAGSGPDYYNATTMSQSAINVGDMFAKTYTHPVSSTSGIHTLTERSTASAGWNVGGSRHVECTDCHSAHGAQAGTHTIGSNVIGAALLGSWGVKPTAWGAAGTQHTSFTKVDFTDASGSSTQFEAHLCFKCHSYFSYQNSPPNAPSGAADGSPATQTDVVTEFNPNNRAHHAVAAVGNHPVIGTFNQTFVAPWGPGSTVACSDCHSSDASGDPAGTHGSANRWMLRGNETGTGDAAVFCFNCHLYDVYDENGTNQSLARVSHPINGQHIVPPQNGIWCMNCHGGATLGGMHGTNMGVGPGGGVDTMGEAFLNGAALTGITRATTSKNSGGCWTKGAVDSVNTCTKGHGDMGWQANYNLP